MRGGRAPYPLQLDSPINVIALKVNRGPSSENAVQKLIERAGLSASLTVVHGDNPTDWALALTSEAFSLTRGEHGMIESLVLELKALSSVLDAKSLIPASNDACETTECPDDAECMQGVCVHVLAFGQCTLDDDGERDECTCDGDWSGASCELNENLFLLAEFVVEDGDVLARQLITSLLEFHAESLDFKVASALGESSSFTKVLVYSADKQEKDFSFDERGVLVTAWNEIRQKVLSSRVFFPVTVTEQPKIDPSSNGNILMLSLLIVVLAFIEMI